MSCSSKINWFELKYFPTECVQGTNIVCTPFTYDGVNYDDCATSYWIGDWCLVKSPVESFYPSCGECVEQL